MELRPLPTIRETLYLCREMEISMAEAGRLLGVGISAIAMAIRKEEQGKEV